MRSSPAARSNAVRHKYSKPPVTERVIEIHVIPGSTPLSTAHEALAQRWTEYPTVEVLPIGSVAFEVKSEEGKISTSHQADERLRFWRRDRKRLYQVGSDIFVANDLLAEPGWDDLLPMFRSGYSDYLDVLRPRKVIKGILRYLNRIRFPKTMTVQDLFTIFPRLPDDRQLARAPFRMMVDMGDKGSGPSVLLLAFTGTPEEPEYALDLTVESASHSLDDLESAVAWLTVAHDRMTELFESSITPGARTLFEVKEG